MAQSELETADWLKESDEESRKIFKESYSSVLRTVADRRRERQERDDDKMEVRGFPAAPPQHDNPAYHAAIQDAYALIAEERNEFLGAQHLIASSDPRLAPLVEKKLNELGCGEYWGLLNAIDARHHISTPQAAKASSQFSWEETQHWVTD